jgi:lipid A 3-O-deacylase
MMVLTVLTLVRPASAFDPEATFAKGTTIFGLQVGGGAANNVEEHRTVSDISFLNLTPRVSYLFFAPFGSGLLRSAVEPGLEGWFQYYLSPESATAQGLKVALRYHFIGLGRVVPYLEATAGAAGTSLKVPEINSTFTFVLEGGAGLSYFVTDTVAINAGYRFQHISNGHTSQPNRGFNSDAGVVGVSFYFKWAAALARTGARLGAQAKAEPPSRACPAPSGSNPFRERPSPFDGQPTPLAIARSTPRVQSGRRPRRPVRAQPRSARLRGGRRCTGGQCPDGTWTGHRASAIGYRTT